MFEPVPVKVLPAASIACPDKLMNSEPLVAAAASAAELPLANGLKSLSAPKPR